MPRGWRTAWHSYSCKMACKGVLDSRLEGRMYRTALEKMNVLPMRLSCHPIGPFSRRRRTRSRKTTVCATVDCSIYHCPSRLWSLWARAEDRRLCDVVVEDQAGARLPE